MVANEALFDAVLRHQVQVRRLAAGEAREILELLEKADEELVKLLRKRLGRLAGRPVDFTSRRYLALIQAIREQRAAIMKDLRRRTRDNMVDLAKLEADFEGRIVQASLPVELDLATVPIPKLRQIVTQQPFSGGQNAARTLRQWFEGLERADRQRLREAIQLGLVQGETVDQMVRRIAGTRAAGFADGVLAVTRRGAEVAVRTAVNHVSNAAREEFHQANADLAEALMWNSTLDGRTCITAGHLVELADGGERAIEDIAVGDMVIGGLSWIARRVVGTSMTEDRQIVSVTFEDGRSVFCTPDHPFLTLGGWMEASILTGYRVLARGARTRDSRVVSVEPAGTATVYDIEVERDHSFICEGVVVHNSAVCRARDGKFAPLGDSVLPEGAERLVPEGARPPAHPQCRSVMIPLLSAEGIAAQLPQRPVVRDARTRRQREIDFRQRAKRKEGSNWSNLTETQRRRLIREERLEWTKDAVGQVPGDTSYPEFLRRQPKEFVEDVLGVTKARLFRRGELPLDRFVDQRGRELTLTELARQEPEAFISADLDPQRFID